MLGKQHLAKTFRSKHKQSDQNVQQIPGRISLHRIPPPKKQNQNLQCIKGKKRKKSSTQNHGKIQSIVFLNRNKRTIAHNTTFCFDDIDYKFLKQLPAVTLEYFLKYITAYTKQKAGKIFQYRRVKHSQKPNKSKYIFLPTKSITTTTENNLSMLDIKFFNTISKTINSLITTKQNNELKIEGGIYSINCHKCHKKHIGETWRNEKKRL